ncbi:MAG: carbonic anhydrase [Pyrinomonadaceae bacterium]
MFDDIKDCLWIGCSDIPGAGDDAISPLSNILYHDNIANLVAVSDINCLSVIQYAVDLCRVETIVICGHYGCRGVATAVANRHFDFLSNWLNPVVGTAAKYSFVLDSISDTSDRLDALCELNVIEQVAAASRTTVVRDAWESGQILSVRGLILDETSGFLEDLQLSMSKIESPSAEYTAAIVSWAKRWNRPSLARSD